MGVHAGIACTFRIAQFVCGRVQIWFHKRSNLVVVDSGPLCPLCPLCPEHTVLQRASPPSSPQACGRPLLGHLVEVDHLSSGLGDDGRTLTDQALDIDQHP